ncbi:alpha/beta fold hydrolase [candidate division KSB1 bacterium]
MRKEFLILVLLIFVIISCTSSERIEDGYLDINGTTLYYKTMGSGEPIVVLHGGPGFDHRQFLPYIWELSSNYKVILYDQRGTGLSSDPVDSASITIDNFIEDIEGIRNYFNIDKMNLLGHSWGGILAMYYAISHQDNLKSLILCSTTASVEAFGEMRANYTAARLPEDTEMISEIASSDEFAAGDPETIKRFWQVFFKPYFPDQSNALKLDLEFTENTIRYSNDVANYVLGSIGAFDIHEDIKAITCPVLVIHGDSDPMPVKYAEMIHESIPNSEFVIAEQAGHWLFVDATEQFRRSIFGFLGRIDK